MDNKDKINLESLYESIYIKEHNVKVEDKHKKKVRNEDDELEPSTGAQIDDDEGLESKITDDFEEIEEDPEDYLYDGEDEDGEKTEEELDNSSYKIPHGLQPVIEEAKKKESIVKKIKKSAKKSGKKITSEPVKRKVVKESFHDVYNFLTQTLGLQMAPESSLKYAMTSLAAAYVPLATTAAAIGIKEVLTNFYNLFKKDKSIGDMTVDNNIKNEVEALKKDGKNSMAADKLVNDLNKVLNSAKNKSVENEIKTHMGETPTSDTTLVKNAQNYLDQLRKG